MVIYGQTESSPLITMSRPKDSLYTPCPRLMRGAGMRKFKMSCLSWNWKGRSSVKIAEGTHEKRAKASHRQEKAAILRRHLLDKVPVSDRCDELGLPPTVFYRWQKELFENGAAAFQGKSRPDHQAEQQRIEFLEKKIQTKDEVLAELMAEHIALK